MKRSEINTLMRDAVRFMAGKSFLLPPFAYWRAADWQDRDSTYRELFDNQLGWDITDFGSGDFQQTGLLLFTLRNGNLTMPLYPKTYAEKIMIVDENQVTPLHFHRKKMEDIINRGGGNLLIRLYNSTPDGGLAATPVTAQVDGHWHTVSAGTEVCLVPGESITLVSGVYHTFKGEAGKGKILVGEVSKVNDDQTDNRFYEPVGRFPAIEEDEEPLYLLSMDYPRYWQLPGISAKRGAECP
ncbi:MAG: D-lyxose/D-mannose family sugar isomerase [Clostridiaceae bacterium]|nr:D-lyxose/D-mannose family sugar isomerase [Clostridiaceae bacterium]